MKRLSQLLGLQFTGQPDAPTPADQRRIRTLLIISWLNLLALLATSTGYLLINHPIPLPAISHTIPIIAVLLMIRFQRYREAIMLFVMSHVAINFFNLMFSDSTNYLFVVTSFLSVSMFLYGRKVVIYALVIMFALSISVPLTAGVDRYLFVPRETTIMFAALGIMIVAVVSYVHDGDLKEIEVQGKAIRENAARLQSILDSIPGFILTIDDKLRVTSISSSIFQDSAAADALVGQPYHMLIREDYRAYVMELLEAGLHRNEIGNFEIQGQDDHWYRGRIAPIITDGKAEAVTVIALESTEQKTIDEVLRQYADEVSDLYNNAPGGYHSIDSNGVIVQMNDTELRWLGYERDEVVGRLNYRDLLTPESVGVFDAAFPVFKTRGWMKDIEVDMVRKDGSTLSIIGNATALLDARGEYLMSRTTVFDVTELKRAQEALRQSEERYKTISQLTSDFYLAFHLEQGRAIVDWMAGAWESITGYDEATLHGKGMQLADLTHPDDLPRFNEHLALVAANQKTVLDVRMFDRDRKLLWLRIHLSPVWNTQQNRLESAYASVQNITDYKQAEDAKRTHEERYRLLARNMPQSAVYLFDRDLRYIVAEGAALSQYGFSSAALEGKTMDEVLPPEQAQYLSPRIRQTLQGEKLNFEYTASDQHAFRIEMVPITNESGEITTALVLAQDITERKAAENALRDSEERYRMISELISDYAYAYRVEPDATLVREWVTDSYTRITGYPIGEVDSRDIYSLYTPDDRQRAEVDLRATLDGQQTRNEYQILTKDGQTKWLSISRYPIWDENEQRVVRFFGAAQDITERKAAENALRENEERYRMISELISDYAYSYQVEPDGSFKREWITDSYTRITGYAVGEVDQDGVYALFSPEEHNQVAADVQNTLNGARTHSEYQILTKSGEKKWLSISRYPIWDEKQQRVVRYLGAARDITERKATENALRDSEERFKGAFELSPIGMALVTPEGKWLKVNQSLLEMLGYGEQDLLMTDFQLITPEEDLKHDLYFAWHLLRDTFQSYRMEKRYIRKNGSILTVLLSVNMVRNTDGTPLYAIAQMVDLNELKEKENFLRQSEAQTRALLDAIPDTVFRISAEGKFLSYKGVASDLYRAPEAFLGRSFREVLPPELAETTAKNIALAQETRQLETFEYQLNVPRFGVQDFEARIVVSDNDEIITIIRNITDRKRAEAAVRESNQRYDELVANIPAAVYRVRRSMDGVYRFDFVSSRVRNLNQLEPEALTADATLLFRQMHPEDYQVLTSQFEDSFVTLQPFFCEGRFYVNGAQRWMRFETRPQKEANGEVVWDGIEQDITAQKLAEAAVMESNQRYDELVANIPVMVYRVSRRDDGQYRYDYVSPRIRDLNEIEPEMVLRDSQVLYDQMHPEDRAEMRRLELVSFNNTTPFLWEGPFLVGNRTRWMRIESYPKQLGSGEVVWHGIQQDITAQKEAEIALRHSQRLIEQIANTIPDYIYVIRTASKEQIYVNKHLGLDLGYSVEEVVDYEKSLYADLTYPDDKAHVVQFFRDVMNLPDDTLAQMEFRLQHQDGTWRWFYMRAAIYARDAEGEPTQMFVVVQDVTDRKLVEQELRIAKDAAETASRSKSIFLANTSHELRTPLNAIIGMAQVMSDDESIPIDARNNIAVIHRSGQHLLELINDVLDLSRVEAGRTQVEIQSLDLPQFMQSIRDMMGFQAYSKNLEFGIRFSNNVPHYIKSDEKKLRQVLINLIGNAIKFTDVGFVTVSVDYQAESHELHFKVEDSGCGIAAEEMPKLFEIYNHVLSPARTRQGVGLGLALSKKLVNLLGGEITAASVLNKGSTFSFYVPVTIDNIAPIADQPIRGVLTDEAYRILVVDDYEDSLLLMSGLLKMPGIETQTASGGQQGIDIARAWRPHLIFMDVQMPLVDGYMATARIRAELPDTVIIALTAEMLANSTVFDDAVFKPFRKRLIFETLVKHLNIKYIYDESRTIISDRLDEIGPKDIGLLPASWRQEFQQAAQRARLDEVQRLIDQIRHSHTFQASKLSELAQRFDFEKLIELASDPDDKA